MNAAIAEQLGRIACAYRYLFTSDAFEQLTELILRKCGPPFTHIVYCSSGSEAVESALKIALQYWDARGERSRKHFIARERSYHGNTLGALSASGFVERRRPFEGALLDVSLVSAANAYRPAGGTAGSQLTAFLARELDARIRSIGAERVAGFLFEPVVGAAGGVVPAPEGYARAIREVCDRHGVLMIADEVMCGSGRCGTWRALEHEGVIPDIMAVAKGLAGGYIPLGATVFTRAVGDTIVAEQGSVLTGHTYSGHTAACAAGLAVQRIIERESLIERVATNGELLQRKLRDALKDIEAVGDIRGRGYFIGVELVSDRTTRTPFPAARSISHHIGSRAFANGLICYPCAGHAGEGRGDSIIIAPPFNASDAELDELVEILARSMRQELA